MKASFKKTFLFLFATAFLLAGVFSIDYGGAVKNVTSFKGNSFSSLKLDQLDDVSLWLKIPIAKDGSVYFITEGLYEFEYKQSEEEAYNRLDIDLFKLAANIKLAGNKSLNISAGRFIYSDVTGIVFRQNADGIFLGLDTSLLSVSAYGALTGLLNANLVEILDHPNDNHSYDKKAVYDLAQNYAVASAAITFPRLFKSQSLSAQFLGAFKVQGTSYNRMYGTLAISGPVYKTLYYELSSTLGFQSYDGGSLDLSNLSRLNFSWFTPFKDLTFNLGAVYASGSNGGLEAFRAFSKINAYNSFVEPQYAGIIKGSFSASIKPLSVLLLNAGCDVIADASSSSVGYKGFQYNLGASWQAFSDVMLGATLLQYIDNDSSDYDKVQLSLNALITF